MGEKEKIEKRLMEDINAEAFAANAIINSDNYTRFKKSLENVERGVLKLMIAYENPDPMSKVMFYERLLGKVDMFYQIEDPLINSVED